MSDLNPISLVLEHPRVLLVFGSAAGLIAAAHSAGPGPTQAVLALLLLVGVPAAALTLEGRSGRVLVLFAAVGVWTLLRPEAFDLLAVPVALLNRLGYVVVPPLILDLVLGERGARRLKLEPIHVYGLAAVLGLGLLVHWALHWSPGTPAAGSGIDWATGIYSGCYLVLLVVALLVRVGSGPEKPKPAPMQGAIELEESGRFGLASRVYEREGQVEKGARAAERAGEWPRAALLYRRAGDHFRAAEMYYRATMLDDALDSYERAGDLAAAAGVCTRLGRVERAMELYERAGDRAAAVRVLEGAGGKPTAEQLRRAGLFERAVQSYEAAGDWLRAAEVSEHDLRDLPRAAELYLKASSFLQAGRILESLGRVQEALQVFAAVPAGALDAARLYLGRGATREAAELLARLPASELNRLEDEVTLLLVARVMLETNRVDDALRIAQGLKRKGTVSGPLCLLLGRAFLEKGLLDLAEEELRTATTLPLETPDDMQAAYLLGCVLERTRQAEEAVRVFHGILQKDIGYADAQERYRRLKAVTGASAGTGQPQEPDQGLEGQPGEMVTH
jgi:tetratricopeptide (TPR) repeat protein